ncbi:MAG: hypothetical protein H6728_11745 [Myxococcales bacterium]|nr:hypothetical protein [Myxococcales bacterium]
MLQVWLDVSRAEFKRIVRNSFMVLIVVYLPIMSYVMRWALPKLNEAAKSYFTLSTYYPMIACILTMILPFMMGIVMGLQLLEEKDEDTLSAVMVTPFSFPRYFFFRVIFYMTLGVVLLIFSHQIIGIVKLPFWAVLVVGICMLPHTMIGALVVGLIAENQVQGFAVMKGSGLLFSGPVLSFLIPQHWDLLIGIIPLFWPVKAYFLAATVGIGGFFWLAIALGVVLQCATAVVLYRLFIRKMFGGE